MSAEMAPAIASGEIDAWKDPMKRIAQRTDAYCKLSGLVTEAGPQWTTASLQPYVDVLIDARRTSIKTNDEEHPRSPQAEAAVDGGAQARGGCPEAHSPTAQMRGWPSAVETRSVRTSLEVVPDALEGGWALVTSAQSLRLKLEDADVRASDLERGKHDSQLH
jgi:hypothetical protein